jgi:hypothetical protein
MGMGAAWRQTRLLMAKFVWNFDVQLVGGRQGAIFDPDFNSLLMWGKAQVRACFRPIERKYSVFLLASSFER